MSDLRKRARVVNNGVDDDDEANSDSFSDESGEDMDDQFVDEVYSFCECVIFVDKSCHSLSRLSSSMSAFAWELFLRNFSMIYFKKAYVCNVFFIGSACLMTREPFI